jgi:hypothetical protein
VRSSNTFIRVLSRKLGDSVSDLAPDRVVVLFGKATKQFCANGVALGFLQGEEEVRCLA